MDELVPQVHALALLARNAGMGFNIDAEEQDRLDLSLDVIEAVLASPALRGWDGFAGGVRAYGKRAAPVLDWLHGLATALDRRIMVRLVKGAYWDGEIKTAQVAGLPAYPVWTRKAATDLNYRHCARRLLAMERIYPQFATHNAQTVATVLELAGNRTDFEFLRLHGMGEALHERVHILDSAPHLAQPLAFVMPSYKLWETPFYGVGLKMYDLLAGRAGLGATQWLGAGQTQRLLPGEASLNWAPAPAA